MKRSELKRKTPLKTGKPMARSSLRMKPDAATLSVKIRRKCCICKVNPPANPMAKVCSTACALELVNIEKQKRERAETRARRENLKTRSDYIKEAQSAFNAFIRERDKDKPCICCGRISTKEFLTGSNWDAGHYRSVGSAPHLRFHENNVHRQLSYCNQHRAGRAVDYRIGLIARIGLAAVEALEADNMPRKWGIEELKAIKAKYKAKLKELQKGV